MNFRMEDSFGIISSVVICSAPTAHFNQDDVFFKLLYNTSQPKIFNANIHYLIDDRLD